MKTKKIGYALIGLAIVCLILMLLIWLYIIWTPEHDARLDQTQAFIFTIMMLTGFGGTVLVI